MPSKTDQELETLLRARYPLIYIVSWEESRVENALREICSRRGKKMFVWTVTQGMLAKPGVGGVGGTRAAAPTAGGAPAPPRTPFASPSALDKRTQDPIAALDFIMDAEDGAVFVLKDFHSFINDDRITRRLRDLAFSVRHSYKNVVILAPELKLPADLEKEVTVVDYGLPSIQELDVVLEQIIQAVKGRATVDVNLTPEQREHVLEAALGLTLIEAENVFARSIVEKERFDVDVILSEKEQIIRKSGILEFFRRAEGMNDVGGLDELKEWMRKRTQASGQKAREFGLPAPKGILLLGVQGCGKSLMAKAVASQWKLPLLRLDVGKIFGGIVGSSEENMRRAIRTAESVAPAILWVDELEKGFAGIQSSGASDAGTTSRVFASFITWLQEKTAPVFVVATANRIEDLPPELMRKGRFDEIFFVDLPAEDERDEIFEIHFRKRRRNPEQFDLKQLAAASEGFSGAEIEQAIIGALYDAFDAGHDITTEDVLRNVRESVPLSRTMEESIDRLRDWASTRARPASGRFSGRESPVELVGAGA